MPVHNADIAAIFDEIADLLEISGANPFRVRAYRNGARTAGAYARDIRSLIENGRKLPKLPGIGPELTKKIHEIVASGSCALLEQLHRTLPPAISELLKIPGLGPKRVSALHVGLKVATLADLEAAARAGSIRGLAGFGRKTESRILQALEARAPARGRFRQSVAAQYAESLRAYLEAIPGVNEVVIAGSFRRRCDTVGDLDILVTARGRAPVMKRFCAYDEVREVLAQGATRSSVVLGSGLQVDLRLIAPASYGAALHYFTGSKAHNIAVRRLGRSQGLKINEYGVFRGKRQIAGQTETSLFEAVGLPYVEPELREDRGEIEAARAGALPRLVTREDLKGDLHLHTKASDGRNSIKEMALAARAAGLEYIAVTEHSRRLAVARGLDPGRLARQIDEIDRLNEALPGITILKGIEVDILEDGALDLPDSVLERLDLVVGAIHGAFDFPRRKQTARVMRAMNHRCFTILAHPGGRLIGSREPCQLDMLAISREARKRGCFLELNSQPERLDLQDTHCQMAREEGVLVSVNSDSHSVHGFANLNLGIGQARRGWLGAEDVLNTRALAELRPLLQRTMR